MTTNRRGLTKRLRFDVFKRDKFTCQYCGQKAPEVVLHVDHVEPVAKGGTDDILNLVTSCVACNSGKSDRRLTDASALEKQRDQLEQLEERRQQLEMMLEWQRSLRSIENDACEKLAEFWTETVPGWALNERGKLALQKLITKYGAAAIIESIQESARMYLEIDPAKGIATESSQAKVWEYTCRLTASRRLMAEKPHMRELFYIRGIVRNRVDCVDWVAIRLLEEAYDAGVPLDTLKTISMSARTWSSWQNEILDEMEYARKAAAQ